MTPFLNNPTEPTEAFRILIVEDEAIVAESLKDQLVNGVSGLRNGGQRRGRDEDHGTF